MKRIAQNDENGCGIACVAMIADVSYEEAQRIVFPKGRVTLTTHKHLRSALFHYGITLQTRRSLVGVRFNDLQRDGLVWTKIEWRGRKWLHWMVWDASSQALIDPYHGDVRLRSSRMVAIYEVERPPISN